MTVTIQILKMCARCKTEKAPTEFYKRKDRPGGTMSHCILCEKTRNKDRQGSLQGYSKKSYEKYKEKVCMKSAVKGKEKLDYINKIKESKPCFDCGQSFLGRPECLDFDHIDSSTKEYNLSRMRWQTYEEIDKEIAKCEVVCSNCHRTRTKKRDQYRIAALQQHKNKKAREITPAPSVSVVEILESALECH